MTYILLILPNFQVIWNFGIFDNIPDWQYTIIFGGLPRVCANYIQKFWLLWGFLSSPSPYSLHSPTPCLSVCMSADIGVGRLAVWMMRESSGRVFVCLPEWLTGRVSICLAFWFCCKFTIWLTAFLFIVFLQWLTRRVSFRQATLHSRARAYYM